MTDEVGYLYVWRDGDTVNAVRVCGIQLDIGGRCLRPHGHDDAHMNQRGQEEWGTTTPPDATPS